MRKNKGKVVPMDPALRRSKPHKGRRSASPDRKRTNKAEKIQKIKRRRQTESIQEHKRGMSIRRSTTFVAGLFFVAVLIYLVRTLFTFMTTPDIPVEMIRVGSVDVPQVIEGIIIRDETVYTAPRDGVVQFHVYNYERVRPGAVVASIQNVQAVANIQDGLVQVEERIMEIQDIRGNLSAADPAVQLINGRIQNMVDQRLSRHINLNMTEAYALRDSIVQNVNRRNQMIVAETLDVDVRADLGLQHQILMGQLDTNLTNVAIGEGGILAPMIDGFEADLTFENMYYLTREQTLPNLDFNQILPQREVYYGDEVFKIVNNNRWYIAAYIPNELVEGFNTAVPRNIFIEGRSNPLTVNIHHISPGFEESFVIFSSTAYMIDFLNTRNIAFRTTDTVQYGLRVSNTAIAERAYLEIPLACIHGEDQQTYVVRVMGDEDLVIPISITSRDSYVALVSADLDFLGMGSILREKEDPSATRIVSEKRLVQGVFRVINGIASFAPVNLPEYMPEGGGHIILDPALNPSIRAYDHHIVTDASAVEDGDIVFGGVR